MEKEFLVGLTDWHSLVKVKVLNHILLSFIGSFFSCIIPASEFGPGPVQPDSTSTTTVIGNNAFSKKGRKLTE